MSIKTPIKAECLKTLLLQNKPGGGQVLISFPSELVLVIAKYLTIPQFNSLCLVSKRLYLPLETHPDKNAIVQIAIKLKRWSFLFKLVKLNLRYFLSSPISLTNDVFNAACEYGDIEIVVFMLENVYGKLYSFGKHLLKSIISSSSLSKNITKKEVASIADLFDAGSNPLLTAIYHNQLDIVALLMKNDISSIDPSLRDNAAIQIAVRCMNLPILKFLLKDKRCDPTTDRNFPLRWAATNSLVDILEVLLKDDRVDPADRNNYAIKWAIVKDHESVVEILLKVDRVKTLLNADRSWETYYKKLQEEKLKKLQPSNIPPPLPPPSENLDRKGKGKALLKSRLKRPKLQPSTIRSNWRDVEFDNESSFWKTPQPKGSESRGRGSEVGSSSGSNMNESRVERYERRFPLDKMGSPYGQDLFEMELIERHSMSKRLESVERLRRLRLEPVERLRMLDRMGMAELRVLLPPSMSRRTGSGSQVVNQPSTRQSTPITSRPLLIVENSFSPSNYQQQDFCMEEPDLLFGELLGAGRQEESKMKLSKEDEEGSGSQTKSADEDKNKQGNGENK